MERLLRGRAYDAIIGRGQEAGYVLTRVVSGIRILDMANLAFLEMYYGGAEQELVDATHQREINLFRSVDHILVHHDILLSYVRLEVVRDIEISGKLLTARMGCGPAAGQARHSTRPRIVYAGSYYWMQDPWLLSELTRVSPVAIHCYGPTDPNRSFLPCPLQYRGYARDISFLSEYQVGLITVSRDRLRQHSPSTKFADYFSHGLPVLFPSWMKEGFCYPGAAFPYDESSFAAQVVDLLKAPAWGTASRSATMWAKELSWDRVLLPLDRLVSAGGSAQGTGPAIPS
jgi:hypothetical protein